MNHLVIRSSRVILNHSFKFRGGVSPMFIAGRTFSFSPRAYQSDQNNNNNNNREFRHSEDLAQERYDLRADEPIDKKRARLLYQSRKRGMLENGVILASFADKFLANLDKDQLDQYDRLINLPTNDWDIFYWATKTKPTPAEFETPVMQMLRHHLRSKVSSSSSTNSDERAQDDSDGYAKSKEEDGDKEMEDNRKKSETIPRHKLDEIVMPAIKDKYELEVDSSAISLTDYERELFDNRIEKFPGGKSIVRMTEWRKGFFLKRLRRSLPSPVSLRNLDDAKSVEVFTQKVTDKTIAKNTIMQTDLIDSNRDRQLKHHNLMQYLMSYKFTNDVKDYDDEAEAWAEIIWHRSYGSADVTIAPSKEIKCTTCSANLHCCDPGLNGYLPKELFAKIAYKQATTYTDGNDADDDADDLSRVKCQRCQFNSVYNVSLSVDTSSRESYEDMMREIQRLPRSIICLLVDLTDFPCSIWEGLIDLIGTYHQIIVVGNKLDMLPYDGVHMIERVTESLKGCLSILRPGNRNLHIQDVMVLSARTSFGVEALVTRLYSMAGDKEKDIYLLGCSNSGKSTLFNALLQSDLSAIRQGDILGRVSKYKFPGTQHNLLRFPIDRLDGWQLEIKKKRLKRIECNYNVLERSLMNQTRVRQATTPHSSLLIDRLDYPPTKQSSIITTTTTTTTISEQSDSFDEDEVQFTEDHPLRNIKSREPLSARREDSDEFREHAFIHQTPSISHPDQLHDLLTNDEKLEVFPHETIIPRKYSIRPLQSIFIAGLARLDLLTANSTVQITIFASRYLPVHVIATRKADQFYNQFLGTPYLGVPFGDEQRLKEWPELENGAPDFHIRGVSMHQGAADIVLSSVGWALITLVQDQECIVRGFTPGGRGIFRRYKPVLPFGVKLDQMKIRDTPLFRHPNYKIERMSAQ